MPNGFAQGRRGRSQKWLGKVFSYITGTSLALGTEFKKSGRGTSLGQHWRGTSQGWLLSKEIWNHLPAPPLCLLKNSLGFIESWVGKGKPRAQWRPQIKDGQIWTSWKDAAGSRKGNNVFLKGTLSWCSGGWGNLSSRRTWATLWIQRQFELQSETLS